MSETEARAAIDLFFEGFNAEDDSITRRALNYPHIRLASGTVRVIESSEHFKTPFALLKERERWHHSTLDAAEVIHSGSEKVHFAIRFSRYRGDGERYATHQALWVVTRVAGHWGIQARSSFAP